MKPLAIILLALSVITSTAGPSLLVLNRRFDNGKVGPRQQAYLWSNDLLRLIRPELRDSGALAVYRLSDEEFNGDNSARIWAATNRRGLPVKPRAEFLLEGVNLVATDESEYVPTYEQFDGFDRLRIYVQDGVWEFQVRLAEFSSIWQPVATLSPGDVRSFTFETEYHKREYRLVRL